MNMKLVKPFTVPISLCDRGSLLSYHGHFSLFMDLASEHGPQIGLGLKDLGAKNLFWLTVKTKIRFHARPAMLDTVTASTWPEAPGRVRCNRYYTIQNQQGDLLAEGKTEWALIDTSTGRLCRFADVYPANLSHCSDVVCDTPFSRIDENFAPDTQIGTYTVKSTDIDLGRHMNNAAYVKAIFGFISCDEVDTVNISEIEATFKSPCFEGETLIVYRRNTQSGTEMAMVKPDGKTAFLAKITY